MRKTCYAVQRYWLPILLSILVVMMVACNTISDKTIVKGSNQTPVAPIPTATPKSFPQAVQDELYPMRDSSLYAQFDKTRNEQPSRLMSIEKQIEETKKAIQRAERDKQLASEEDITCFATAK